MKIKGRSVTWLLFKISITISTESSQRDLLIDMVVDRFIVKYNENTFLFCFISLHEVWDYFKLPCKTVVLLLL